MNPEDEKPKQEGVANFGKPGEDENTSIGSGSSDQGMNAEDQSEEDDIIAMEEHQLQEEKAPEPTSHRPPPTHGLVEEGPGPDA